MSDPEDAITDHNIRACPLSIATRIPEISVAFQTASLTVRTVSRGRQTKLEEQ